MDFSLHLTGFPALLFIALAVYLLIYLPIKGIVTVGAYFKRRAANQLLLKSQPIIAEYLPPADLGPAEIGFLYDAKTHYAELFATIVDLNQKGFLRLETRNGKLYLAEIGSKNDTLPPIDKWFLGFLAERVGQPISKRMLRAAQAGATLTLNQQLYQRGFVVSSGEQLKRMAQRLLGTSASLFILTILLIRPDSLAAWVWTIGTLIVLSPIYFWIAFFLFYKYQKITGSPWIGTPALKAIWPDIEGYRQYIQLVELDNIRFENQALQQRTKNHAHPYAIAFGFNTGWRKQL